MSNKGFLLKKVAFSYGQFEVHDDKKTLSLQLKAGKKMTKIILVMLRLPPSVLKRLPSLYRFLFVGFFHSSIYIEVKYYVRH